MLDDFREQAKASFLEEADPEVKISEVTVNATSGKKFLGLTPAQRLLVAIMLLGLICLLGALLLLVTEKIVLPFIF